MGWLRATISTVMQSGNYRWILHRRMLYQLNEFGYVAEFGWHYWLKNFVFAKKCPSFLYSKAITSSHPRYAPVHESMRVNMLSWVARNPGSHQSIIHCSKLTYTSNSHMATKIWKIFEVEFMTDLCQLRVSGGNLVWWSDVLVWKCETIAIVMWQDWKTIGVVGR